MYPLYLRISPIPPHVQRTPTAEPLLMSACTRVSIGTLHRESFTTMYVFAAHTQNTVRTIVGCPKYTFAHTLLALKKYSGRSQHAFLFSTVGWNDLFLATRDRLTGPRENERFVRNASYCNEQEVGRYLPIC